jgi:hypothetical protein
MVVGVVAWYEGMEGGGGGGGLDGGGGTGAAAASRPDDGPTVAAGRQRHLLATTLPLGATERSILNPSTAF